MSDKELRWRRLEEALSEAAEQTVSSALIVAPFIKERTLSRVLAALRPGALLTCITRWHPQELKAGVSDLGVFDVVRRANGVLRLRQDLHAKYYRFDDRAFLGSANLTASGLGQGMHPNFELLLPVQAGPTCLSFERDLTAGTREVTAEFRREMAALVDALPDIPPIAREVESASRGLTWIPSLRSPKDLFSVYSNDERLPLQTEIAGRLDLEALGAPAGLTQAEFHAFIGATLLLTPIVGKLDQLIAVSRPFGVVRQRLQEWLNVDREVSSAHLQALIRWLIHFLPHRYEYSRLRNSERLHLRAGAASEGPQHLAEDF